LPLDKEPTLFSELSAELEPLAHRMRPSRLEDFLGQKHLLGPGQPLRQAIERGTVNSLVFWGPPGCGKTTLARLISRHTDKAFEIFSAVTEGVPRVREILREARERRDLAGRGTILFCDEIHRFNKAQQDAFLPSVEEGVITLIGATTENPSFELNSALLSRLQVFVLEPLDDEAVRRLIRLGWQRLGEDDRDGAPAPLRDDAVELITAHAQGDARRALNYCEALWAHARGGADTALAPDDVARVLQRKLARYDKSGEEHYNLISALHKSIRGSDVDAALYWLARMLEGGEDPAYLLRRLVRMATEDVGLSDPRALSVSLAAREAYHFLGTPEGELAIAEAVVYLASAPKSNSVYRAWQQARQAAGEYPAEPVPKHLRNAPTRLLDELGYGKGYRYDHDEGGYAAGQEYLPPPLQGNTWYEPTQFGFEKTLAERLKWWADKRRAANKP
jgi:putative ATPase